MATSAHEAAFMDEVTESNLRRLRVLLPLFTVIHVAHAVVFHLGAASETDPVFKTWRTLIERIHEASAVIAVGLAVLVFALSGTKHALRHALTPLVYACYLLHAVVIVSADQLAVTAITPYIGYMLGCAVVLGQPPRQQIPIAVGALIVFVIGITQMQASAEATAAILPNGFTLTAVGVALSWFLWAARRRDFDQRTLIAEQRGQLEALNRDLERRVEQQVAEIVARNLELDTVNAQLQAQVTARTLELGKVLEQLKNHAPEPEGESIVLADRYELGRMLGAGGMGAVYEALDRRTGSTVAIKRIKARSSNELVALRRFLTEARSTAKVLHPAVIRMLDVDITPDGTLYQVLERVRGETLAQALNRIGKLRPSAVARVGEVLFGALAAAHEQGVVHRDVKPGNAMIMASPPGLKLLDFGIARLYEDVEASSTLGHTQTGMVIGTPAYMGPEQLAADPNLTDRADVYAAGITLFLLLTGRFPFEDITYKAMLRNHDHPAPDVRAFAPHVPEPLARAVAHCLERAPMARPSAKEAARRFAECANGLDPRTLDALVRETSLANTPSDHDTFPRGDAP